MKKVPFLVMAAAAVLTVSSCASQKQLPENGIALQFMDTSVRPQDDFFTYVNGNWVKTVEIPSDKASWGSFNEINERNVANLKALMTYVSNDVKALSGTNNQKLRDFYLTAIDSAKADKEGVKPISADLASIDAIKTKDDLFKRTDAYEFSFD